MKGRNKSASLLYFGPQMRNLISLLPVCFHLRREIGWENWMPELNRETRSGAQYLSSYQQIITGPKHPLAEACETVTFSCSNSMS